MSPMSRRDALGALGATAALAAAGRLVASAFGAQPSWSRIRDRFLLPEGYVFLNTGSLGACPDVVLDEAQKAWRRLERAPVSEAWGPLQAEAEDARVRAGAFIGAGADEISVTINTTDAMNMVAEGVALRAGDRVLTTDHEHHGGQRCWEHAERHRGAVIDRITLPLPPGSPDEIVELVGAAMTPRTRVVSVSHVTFTTGLRLPIREIAEVAHAHGALFVVDGAQAPGGIRVDVKALGCDAYATSAHKWMLAPKGTGLLYINGAARDRITPTRLDDGPSVYTASSGSRDLPSIIGLGAGVDFLERLGPDAIEAHNLALRNRLYEALVSIPGVRVVSPAPGALAAPIVSVALPDDIDSASVKEALRAKHAVSVKLIPKDRFNGLRFSTHVYNSDADIDRLLSALKTELAG